MEIARDLVDAGLVKQEDEEEAAKRIQAKLDELEGQFKEMSKDMTINEEPLV